jgi:S-adenosylmethionine synthetase
MAAALIARYISKNCLHAGLCDYMSIQLSYAIGFKYPVSVFVNTYDSCHVPGLSDADIAEKISELFDLSTYGIVTTLNLRQPMYEECSAFGWFGRTNKVVHKTFSDVDGNVKEMDVELFTWEKLDAVDKIKEAFGL